jgi:hypothetical protein
MFQVYQYEDRFLLKNSEGHLRVLSVLERERLLGFDDGYTSACFKNKAGSYKSFVLQNQLLGNSFCVYVISWLASQMLYSAGLHKDFVPYDIFMSTGVSPSPWAEHPKFVSQPGSNTPEDVHVVLDFLRVAERGGTDVRLDLGVPFRPKAWPRTGISTTLWNWRIIQGFPWHDTSEHINVLEMRAFMNCLKWRTRKPGFISMRFMHLLDSQVCTAILTKGRSSSRKNRCVLRRISALLLACHLFPIYAFVHSEENPADIPSRWQWLAKRKLVLARSAPLLQKLERNVNKGAPATDR